MKRILSVLLASTLLGAGCMSPAPAPTPVPKEPAPAPMDDMQMPPSQPESSEQNMPPQTPPPESSEQNMPPQKPTPPAADQSSTYNIIIQSFAFAPVELQLKKGDKISVTNRDAAPHSVTSDTPGLFDTGVLNQDKSATIDTTKLKPGTYSFHCSVHPSMKGTLVVN